VNFKEFKVQKENNFREFLREKFSQPRQITGSSFKFRRSRWGRRIISAYGGTTSSRT
jgi:hypothetical protein